jgi:hypothetical protein
MKTTREIGARIMSGVDPDLDAEMSDLQREWREVCAAGIVARSYYQTLAASSDANADLLAMARERLERTVALKAQIAAKIERVEDKMFAAFCPWRSPITR